MVDYREEVRLGKQIIARVVEAYRKIRNTLRYLASNLYDFDPLDRVALDKMEEVDRYALARYAAAASTVVQAYARYDFPTIFQTINQFTTVDLSAFYADVSKDRLYTFGAGSPERRSAQTAMYTIADGLVRLLAPILPVTTDELWRHLPGHAKRPCTWRNSRRPTISPACATMAGPALGRAARRAGCRQPEARGTARKEADRQLPSGERRHRRQRSVRRRSC